METVHHRPLPARISVTPPRKEFPCFLDLFIHFHSAELYPLSSPKKPPPPPPMAQLIPLFIPFPRKLPSFFHRKRPGPFSPPRLREPISLLAPPPPSKSETNPFSPGTAPPLPRGIPFFLNVERYSPFVTVPALPFLALAIISLCILAFSA